MRLKKINRCGTAKIMVDSLCVVFEADKLVLSQSTPYQVIAEFKQTRVDFMLRKQAL